MIEEPMCVKSGKVYMADCPHCQIEGERESGRTKAAELEARIKAIMSLPDHTAFGCHDPKCPHHGKSGAA